MLPTLVFLAWLTHDAWIIQAKGLKLGLYTDLSNRTVGISVRPEKASN